MSTQFCFYVDQYSEQTSRHTNAAMRLHHVAFILFSTAIIRSVAQTDFSLDGSLDELDMNGADWGDTDSSLFDQAETPNLSSENDLFNLDDSSSALFSLADNPSACMDESEPLSRVRARSGSYCDQAGEHPDGVVPGNEPSAREVLPTQETINEVNCPSDYYQGIFLIPVCSAHDSDSVRPSRPIYTEEGMLFQGSGLQDITWCALSKPHPVFVRKGFKKNNDPVAPKDPGEKAMAHRLLQ